MGSIEAFVRWDRSFCERKKWSILDYLLCGAEKKVKSFTLGCSVRHVSWRSNVVNCNLIAQRAL